MTTRAINTPSIQPREEEMDRNSSPKEGYVDEKSPGASPIDVHSVSDGEENARHTVGITEESELDTAGLKAAFRFAAWSSLILVR